LLVGVMANAAAGGWPGAKSAFAGAALGLLLLLPLVVIRSLGAGDWKLVGALGAFLGPEPLLRVLAVAIVVAGVMGIALAIYKGRLRETLVNMGHMLAAFFTLRLPGPALTLENPQALKVPFGVAAAVAAIAYVGARFVFGVV
jgi:prepilin peptidase CpaA